jgi:hypothetical protein
VHEGSGISRPADNSAPSSSSAPTATATQALTIQGTISADGTGSTSLGLAGKDVLALAKSVALFKLNADGSQTNVGTGTVDQNGQYVLTTKASPQDALGIYFVKLLDIGGAVVGSAVINGAPAFIKGFVLDVPVDALTSFKSEILQTIAHKGVPGVQNYLNVVNTLINSELSGIIVTLGAFTSDFTTIFGAIADSVIAAENVIVSVLQAAGIPVDFSKVEEAQLAIVSGINKAVTTANAKFATDSKNLVAALEEATAHAVAPLDKALFNAIVAGSAMFNSMAKGFLPVKTGGFATDQTGGEDPVVAAFKTTLAMQAEMTLDAIDNLFAQATMGSGLADNVKAAGDKFLASIGAAKTLKELTDAKGAFNSALVTNTVNAVLGNVKTALTHINDVIAALAKTLALSVDWQKVLTGQGIGDALAQFDDGAKDLASQLKSAGSPDSEALATAFKMVGKMIIPSS